MSEQKKDLWELFSEEEMAKLLEPIQENETEADFAGRVAEKAALLLEQGEAKAVWENTDPPKTAKPRESSRKKASRLLRRVLPAVGLLLVAAVLVFGHRMFSDRVEPEDTKGTMIPVAQITEGSFTYSVPIEPGISQNGTENRNGQNGSANTSEANAGTLDEMEGSKQPAEPPVSICFASRDDIGLLLSFAPELSEEEERQFNSNIERCVNRDDYEKVCSWLKDMPLPESEEWISWNLYIYPDRGLETANFGFDARDGAVFQLSMDLSDEDPFRRLQEAAQKNGYQLEPIDNPDTEMLYYCRPDQPHEIEMYYGIADGYFFSLSCARALEAYRNQVAATLHFIKAGEAGSD